MLSLEPTFNPRHYIEGTPTLNETIEDTNLPNLIAQMRALLEITLKNHPEQALVHFSKEAVPETKYTVRIMSSDDRGIDLHHRHMELTNEGFIGDFTFDETDEMEAEQLSKKIEEEIESILKGGISQILIQYLRKHKEDGYAVNEPGYSITSIAI